MTAKQFRAMALSMPEAKEQAHMGHPDFRVGGKIFASLAVDGSWAMVRVQPEEQARLIAEHAGVFEAFAGAWGRYGCTRVWLRPATVAKVRPALVRAWAYRAPPEVLKRWTKEKHTNAVPEVAP